jgi:NDP-sugar pyrophosphorylase family protein
MILAAGLGTRLRPLTDGVPKALVEVSGVPMLEHVARRLVSCGATRLIINVHHHADAIERFIEERQGFGVEVRVSREAGPAPLDTGGGLLAAAGHFSSGEPFILHNVDVVSDIDLAALYAAHVESSPEALATLATSERATSRPLLVDREGVCGVANRHTGWTRQPRDPVSEVRELCFCGLHVISPVLLELVSERGTFSIIDTYMRLIGDGYRLAAFDIRDAWWVDIGTLERLEQARQLSGGAAIPEQGDEDS